MINKRRPGRVPQPSFLCIVVDNRNPHLKAVTTDFEESAALLTECKP